MKLEGLIEGDTLSEKEVNEYGLTKTDSINDLIIYKGGRFRFILKKEKNSYKVKIIYQLPDLNFKPY